MSGGNPMTDLLSGAASSALPQASPTGSPQSANAAQLLQVLSALQKGQNPATGPATTAQSAIPGYQPKPVIPAVAPQVAQGPFSSVGARKRADSQARWNNIANLVNMGVAAYTQKQTRDMTRMVTTLQQATQGKQQAEATLQSDPNNAEAKAQLKQNQDILNDIMSDPKNVKKLQKAFNVPLIGDKGKQTPEYQGLIAAIKSGDPAQKAQAAETMGNKFQKSFPSTQQLSPQMQAQAALIQLGIKPRAGEELQAQTEFLKSMINFQRSAGSDEARLQIANIMAQVKDKELQAQYTRALTQVLGKISTAQILADSGVKRAGIMANAQMTSTQWRMAGQILDTQIKADSSNKKLTDLKTQYDEMTKELNNLVKQGADPSGDPGWTQGAKARQMTQQVGDLRKRQGQLIQQMDQMNLMKFGDTQTGMTPEGSGSSNEPTSPDAVDKMLEGLINAPDTEDQ